MKYSLTTVLSITLFCASCINKRQDTIANFTIIDKTTQTPLANVPVIIEPGENGNDIMGTYYSDANGKITVHYEAWRSHHYYMGCNNSLAPFISGDILRGRTNEIKLELNSNKLTDLNFHFKTKNVPYTDMEIVLLTAETKKFKYFTQNCDGITPVKFKYQFNGIYNLEDTVVFKTEENTEAKIQITLRRLNSTGADEYKTLEYIIPAQPGPITVYQEISLP